MGRKQNALIRQHFKRGAKLQDSSNRYEQTCLSCGEKFPKGRSDSLQTHLTKCVGLSLAQKQNAILGMNNLQSPPEASGSQMGSGQLNGPGDLGQAVGGHQFTSLEVLAEASREAALNDTRNRQGSIMNQQNMVLGGSEPPNTDRFQLEEQYTLDNPPVAYEQRTATQKKATPLGFPRQQTEVTFRTMPQYPPQSRSSSPQFLDNGSMDAAAAARFAPSMVDPQLLGEDETRSTELRTQHNYAEAIAQAAAAFNPDFQTHQNDHQQDHQHVHDQGSQQNHEQASWNFMDNTGGGANIYGEPQGEPPRQEMVMQQVSTSPVGSGTHFIMNGPVTTEFIDGSNSHNGKAGKPKVRGKFNSERRGQIKNVRAMGACVRCRMLKKPCSVGQPCDACRSIESARTWTMGCVRTKLIDLFDLYQSGLHVVLGKHVVGAAKAVASYRPTPFSIMVTHYPEKRIYAAINALEGQSLENSNGVTLMSSDPSGQILRLLDDDDDIGAKLSAYSKRMLSTFIEKEPSEFMRITLETAQASARPDTKLTPSSLLDRTLDLWSMVHILVDSNPGWSISRKLNAEDPPGQGIDVSQTEEQTSYNNIVTQINSGAEKKAALMFKEILNQLERELINPKSLDSFDLFLVCLLIANCVEKTTWLFQSWDQESFLARWPLDRKPLSYAGEGDGFINLLKMWVQTRRILPSVYTSASTGLLATESMHGREYFEKLNTTYDQVQALQAQASQNIFDPSTAHSNEMRYSSEFLLAHYIGPQQK